jgi:CRISPR-associated protein Csh1
MINECLAVFGEMLQEKTDKLIMDTHVPKDGTYLIMKYQRGEFVLQDAPINLMLDKKSKEMQGRDYYYTDIQAWDYYSQLLEMNKRMDNAKIIHSNNYLAFFVKKENLIRKKLTKNIINDYYKILENPYLKYKDSKRKEIYQQIESQIGTPDSKYIHYIKDWVLEHIFQVEQYGVNLEEKNYLKIFFILGEKQKDLELFQKENKRYLLPNIYNKNDFNVKINGEIYGLPNNNMGMNTNKPYLENKTRKITVPYLLNSNDVLLQKNFFDYLSNMACIRYNNIYIDYDKKNITAFPDGKYPDCDFIGGYMRIKKAKTEVEIIRLEPSIIYRDKLQKNFKYLNYLQLDMDNPKIQIEGYGKKISRKRQLLDLLDDIIFSKYLINNFDTEPGALPKVDARLKQSILLGREVINNWFNKGIDIGIESILKKIAITLTLNSIAKGNELRSKHQFNFYYSLLDYYNEGGMTMTDRTEEVSNLVRNKINQKEDTSFSKDMEYYYGVGQLINYFLSLSQTKNKTLSLANPFFDCKNNSILREKLFRTYRKYNYNMGLYSSRVKRLYAMIVGYNASQTIDRDFMLYGFLSNSLVYEKNENKKESTDE